MPRIGIETFSTIPTHFGVPQRARGSFPDLVTAKLSAESYATLRITFPWWAPPLWLSSCASFVWLRDMV